VPQARPKRLGAITFDAIQGRINDPSRFGARHLDQVISLIDPVVL
jgi:hypothetical protein